MVNQMDNAISEVVKCIIDSPEYQECLRIKKQMDDNTDIKERINKIKILQKKYLRSNDPDIEIELNKLENELNDIPIYYEYNKKLEIVNQKINYVTDEINDYFYKLMNEG